MLSACQKKAEGQVVAVVNGEEITLSELNAEIGDLNIPASADKTLVRAEVLQRMVERRLMAQAAKDAGLDRDPTYINQERRMKERLLVSLYGKKAFDTVEVPSQAKIDQYIAAHPDMFAERKRYRLDQLMFDIPSDVNRMKELDSAHSMADVIAVLNRWGVQFQRGTGALDSAQVPAETMKRITALPPGEPFIVPNGGKAVVSVITASEPIVLTAEQVRPMAAQAIRNEELNQIGQQRLAEAKAKAKIEYQTGYEPPAGNNAAASVVSEAASNSAEALPKAQ
ncbi:MAG TPA: EpsD family peptidyl-prolyl cis-trans isomerase [Sphingobium sp.]|nr:EpsD family peptidyl-prolyl cis-trans isomerase [Sphingobium sp.]